MNDPIMTQWQNPILCQPQFPESKIKFGPENSDIILTLHFSFGWPYTNVLNTKGKKLALTLHQVEMLEAAQ